MHGAKNLLKGDIWNVARCLHGEPTEKELQPDLDLGKATKPGFRNCVRKAEDKYRSFGLPTIRKDIPERKFRKIADF